MRDDHLAKLKGWLRAYVRAEGFEIERNASTRRWGVTCHVSGRDPVRILFDDDVVEAMGIAPTAPAAPISPCSSHSRCYCEQAKYIKELQDKLAVFVCIEREGKKTPIKQWLERAPSKTALADVPGPKPRLTINCEGDWEP